MTNSLSFNAADDGQPASQVTSTTTTAPRRNLLEKIQGPADVKALAEADLPQLAQEIRDRLIEAVSKTGGHIGPNLGVVELTIALHRVFDSPSDKFVFDVSHQGYVHKMLTGRNDRIDTIRTYQGLNGFLLRTESEHDCYGAGHAGTALSAALGMAVARDLKGSDENVVVVAGDAAFTCGVSFEALNNVAESTKRFIVVLNDNEWSIAKNVGALAKYFNHLTTSERFGHLRETAAAFVEKIAGRGARNLVGKVEHGVKHLVLPNILFEDLGLHYYGPIDGHDIHALTRAFEFLKHQEVPVLLHIITEKGRGYAPALKQPDKFHGLGKFEPQTGEVAPTAGKTYSQLIGETLARYAREDEKILAITAAMPTGTGLAYFQKEHPKKYFDVGIAEEHAALFACGLATQGFKPFLTIYSTFMQRAYDMIVHDMALQNLPVRLCMDRAGLSGDDGPTHHGLFDIGYLRHIPNLVHMQPKDEDEFADMLWTMAQYEDGPTAIRYPRGTGPGTPLKARPQLLEIGVAEVAEEDDSAQVAIFGLGEGFTLGKEAAAILRAEGISVALINPRWIKPMDTACLENFAKRVEVVCTVEDHVLHNGFGCAVMEHLSEARITTPVVRVGWPDEFIEHGRLDILRELHGLTAANIAAKVRAALGAGVPA